MVHVTGGITAVTAQLKKTGCERTARLWQCLRTPCLIWVFPKIGVSPKMDGLLENPIKMDDLGVPLFLETPICLRLFFNRMYETFKLTTPS